MIDRGFAPDSIDYALWAREAFSNGLRGFSIREVNIKESGTHPDTLSEHYYDYNLTKHGREVSLGGHPVPGEEWLPLSGNSDSVDIVFDSLGRKTTETRITDGRTMSIERWRFDDRGRLARNWFELATDTWHPPQEYFYDENGALERVEVRAPDGSLQGDHFFHDLQNTGLPTKEIMEYDTMYYNGQGKLTAIQLTAFDSIGRVERYQYQSIGFDRAFREPYGFLNVYHDTINGYRMEQYALSRGPRKTTHFSFAEEPSLWVRYDSTIREEDRTTLDSTGEKVYADNHYLPDERYLNASIRTAEAPLQSVAIKYDVRGLLESIAIRNPRNGWRKVLQFEYYYSSTGP